MNNVATPHHEKVPPKVWLVPTLAIVACAGASAAMQWSWRHEVPTRIATHFGADGRADGWMSLRGNILFTLCFGILMPIFLLAVGWAVKQGRAMGGVAAGTAAFLATITAGLVHAQRGVASSADAAMGPILVIALLPALVVGCLVWALIRRRGPQPVAHGSLPLGSATLDGDAGQHVAWIRPVRRSRGALIALGLLSSVVPIMAIFFYFMADRWGALFLLLMSLVVLVPVSMMFATVTVDHRGVQARAMGIRWLAIPLETITSAEVQRSVNPLGDFGGWGIRGGFGGDRGLVTSEGQALRIHRAEQADWVITVDDAERAAAVVNTLVARAHQAS